MNRRIPLLPMAALVASFSFWSPYGRAIDITITNTNAPATPCVLHMGTSPEDVLQADPNGQPGDLMVGGTFSPGDPCISGSALPLPTGSVSLPPGVTPVEGIAFNVNWTAQNATACTFVGTGWSGQACGGSQACSSGTKEVTLSQGSYDFGLSCTNGVDPAVLVADPTFEVLPASTETCGFGLDASVARQTRGDVLFGVHPSVVFSQPLLKWGDLWGFGWTCQMDPNGACATVLDFPFILGSQPVLKAETAKYVSLPFTTAGLLGIVPSMTSGAFKPSSSAGTPGTVIRMSISDRCGDFDPNGPFLSGHPKCMKDLNLKNTFLWTTVASNNVCSFRNGAGVVDPNKTWYVNMKVVQCDDRQGPQMPAMCNINILHQ